MLLLTTIRKEDTQRYNLAAWN